ncbi:MAG: choice-of-anchor J domain-containing protein [Bacteroidales bacterium]|nr:choice-of-anchor J domain-containing protein [Bacteroidales bacterium]MCF8403863.1 choice-of-anchor J domain-containing protein [Bacteroidales bacterium]
MRKLYFLLSFLLLSVVITGQGTINCFPLSANYNTGSTNGTTFSQTSQIKTESAGIEAGWARFDISTIPAGATIQSVELHIYVALDNYAYWRVMSMENDPLIGSAADVFSDCTDGTMYAEWQGSNFPEPDWFIADLGPEAVTTAQSQVADGWFAISMLEWEEFGSYAITCDGWNETNQPFIVVSYLVAGAPLPAFDPIPMNESVAIDVGVDLEWTFGANTEMYDVYFGIDFPPVTKVVDNATAGTYGIFEPGLLNYSTTYYWQVVSKNSASELETPGPIWSFTTMCDAFVVAVNEDFEGIVPPQIPECWYIIENTTSQWAFVQTLTYSGVNESYCLSMENADDPGATLLFISPPIDGGISGKYIDFYAWGYATQLSIGTITDPNDPATYNEIELVDLSNIYLDYNEFEVYFTNYTGNDNYIAFKHVGGNIYETVYIDNILIDYAPTCPKPTGLYAGVYAATSAFVGWTENGSASQWNIEYGLKGFIPTGTPSLTTNQNPHEITGLTGSSVYEFYVQADCGGGDLSYWTGPYEFITECIPADVPVMEKFDLVNIPELPLCWTSLVDSYSPWADALTVDYNFFTEPNCVILTNSDDAYANVLFISPLLNEPVSTLWINFFAFGYSPQVIVGTITNPLDIATFTEFATLDLTNVYEEFEVDFNGYTGTDQYIAFKGVYQYGYQGVFIDNIIIDHPPTCPKPTDPFVSNITNTSADIAWTENGSASLWNIEYGYKGFVPTGTPNVYANSNPFTLLGLETATYYDYYVQADCGSGDLSYWVGPVSFKTACDATSVPYTEGFESAVIPDVPPCIIVENVNEDIKYWYATNNQPYAGNNAIRVDWNGVLAMDDWFYSAPLTLVGGEAYIVQFYYTSNSSSYIEKLEVKWGDSPSSVDMTNGPIFTDEAINYAFTYHQGICYFTPPDDGIYYVGWHGYSEANQYDLYVDEITIDVAPSCLMPSSPDFLTSNSSSAFLTWVENGDAAQWNIEYGYTGFTPSGAPNAVAYSNPFELTGLEPGTAYDFYVQADCGGGDVSWWSVSESFTTLCEAADVPIYEDFDNAVVPQLPNCWMKIAESGNVNADVYTIGYNFYSNPVCVALSNSYDANADLILISPPISDADGASGKYLNFFAFGYAPMLSIGTISDPFNISTYNEITTISLTNSYQEYEVFFTNYTGTDEFIALKGIYNDFYQDIYIDDITIDHPPTCPKPSDLTASGFTQTSAMLGWTENGSASQWNIEYGESGFTPIGVPSVTAGSNPFLLDGLMDGTYYDFYVQADCGGGDLSYWVGPYSFKTLCFAASLPYEEGFEDVFVPLVPPCITVENTNGDNLEWKTSNTSANSGFNHLAISYTYNNPMNDWFFSPPLDLLGGQTYNVVFQYTTNSINYYENLEVKYGDAPNSSAMTSNPIFVDSMFAYNYVYQEASTSFSPATSGIYYLGWHGFSIPGQWDIYIDDIFVEWDNSLVVIASATPDEICEGDSSQLNGTASGGSGNYSYLWTSDPPGFTSSEPNPIVYPDETTNYMLEINDGFVSMYDSVTVVVHQLPGMPGTPIGISFLCANFPSSTYSTSGASGANSYNWILDPSSAGTVSGTGTSITVNWTLGYIGNCNLRVIGVNSGCEGPESNPLLIIRYLPNVTLEPFYPVDISWPAFELTGGMPLGGEYSGTGVSNGWFDPGVAGLGLHTITYTYTDPNFCENFAEETILVDQGIGMHEYSENLIVSILPNPSNGVFELKINSVESVTVNLKVLDNYGKEVYKSDLISLHKDYSENIDLGEFSRGLYYLYVYSEKFNFIEKVIIK